MSTRFAKLMFALVLILQASNLPAQTYYGLLNGIVADERGSAVAGAEVTMTNVAMGKTRSAITLTAQVSISSALWTPDPLTSE